jgi:aliphatic aldoxime dehydratase
MLTVPVDRIETIDWEDYRRNLTTSLPIEHSLHNVHFSAMRNRIPLAACDRLESDAPYALHDLVTEKRTGGRHWLVQPPPNLAMIRSVSFLGKL